MDVTRRDFLTLIAVAGGLTGRAPQARARALEPERLLDFDAVGNVTLLHMTDPHGTLLPVYYREPDTRIGIGDEAGKAPFLSGEALLKRVRDERPGKTLLLDGGDTLQGSATALWTRGEDMIRAMNLLGVEVFTPHWEFTYGIDRVKELFGDRGSRGRFAGDFVCHNVKELNWDVPVFKPYTIKDVGGVRVGVIGQAFPYVPVSHPQRFVPGLTFGIQEDQAQKLVNELRDSQKADLVVLLS